MYTSKALKKGREKIEARMKKLHDKEDELTLANDISEYMDIEGLRKYGRFVQGNIEDLHSRRAFDKLIKLLPEKSYLSGYSNGGKIENGKTYTTHFIDYLVLFDERTVLSICLMEEYKERENIPYGFKYEIGAFVGNEALQIKVENGVCDGTSYVSIVDPSDDYAPYKFNVDGDCSLYNGMKLVDLIGTVDLANVVKKGKEDYHIKK